MQATSAERGIFGIGLTDDSTVQGDFDTVRELKGTTVAVSNGAGEPQKVQQRFNVNKNFDLPFQKATSASFGQNPSESMIFHCFNEGPSSTFDASSSTFLITISYIVDMWELKDLGQS